MNKEELTRQVAHKTGGTIKDTDQIINAVFGAITSELADNGKVLLVGFGTFSVHRRQERIGRNPATGEPITIPAKCVPRISFGATIKNAVSKIDNEVPVAA